jgi:hypothetical protein
MQSMSGSFRNLAALAAGDDGEFGNLSAGGPLSFSENRTRASKNSVESSNKPRCNPVLRRPRSLSDNSNFVSRTARVVTEYATTSILSTTLQSPSLLQVHCGCKPLAFTPGERDRGFLRF